MKRLLIFTVIIFLLCAAAAHASAMMPVGKGGAAVLIAVGMICLVFMAFTRSRPITIIASLAYFVFVYRVIQTVDAPSGLFCFLLLALIYFSRAWEAYREGNSSISTASVIMAVATMACYLLYRWFVRV